MLTTPGRAPPTLTQTRRSARPIARLDGALDALARRRYDGQSVGNTSSVEGFEWICCSGVREAGSLRGWAARGAGWLRTPGHPTGWLRTPGHPAGWLRTPGHPAGRRRSAAHTREAITPRRYAGFVIRRLAALVLVLLLASVARATEPPLPGLGYDHPLAGRIWDVAQGRFATLDALPTPVSAARIARPADRPAHPDHHPFQAKLLAR